MSEPVVHFEVLASSPEKATELQGFYGEVFDWKVNAENPMKYGVVDTGEGIGGGVGADGSGANLTGPTFYVQVADLDATLGQIEARGGKTVMPPMEVPGGPTMAMFTDPDGHRIGLVKA